MYHLTFKKLSVGLLMAFLTGCSTTKLVRELPPPDLLADCPEVVEQLKTNGGLAWTILEYRKALSTCNIDKRSLREWADTK